MLPRAKELRICTDQPPVHLAEKDQGPNQLVGTNDFSRSLPPSTCFGLGTGEGCALSADELRGSLCKMVCLRI